ncbi:hypothetical protein ACFBZI_09385 [Moraxella sp. ZJ142]|uniref:hypothetical protein n=2 Tax=Moraxella marmotae TaxID=3344520 RepID=UPI0035D44715
MGWASRKKWKAFYGGGTVQLLDSSSNKDLAKEGLRQWIWDTSGLLPFTHDIKLHDYLLGNRQDNVYKRWEKLYHLVQVEKAYPDMVWIQDGSDNAPTHINTLNFVKPAEQYIKQKLGNQVASIYSIEHNIYNPSWEFYKSLAFDYTIGGKVLNTKNQIPVYFQGIYEIVTPSNGGVPIDGVTDNATYYHDTSIIPSLSNYKRHTATKDKVTCLVFLVGNKIPKTVEILGTPITLDVATQYFLIPITEFSNHQLYTRPYSYDSPANYNPNALQVKYINPQGAVRYYQERITDLRNHQIGQLARQTIQRVPLELYPPIPLRISNMDMDSTSNLSTPTTGSFINPAKRLQALKEARDMSVKDRIYAKEALKIMGWNAGEFLTNLRADIGNDWGEIDNLAIVLGVPTPDGDDDVPVIRKYWHLYHYLVIKHAAANYFKPMKRSNGYQPSHMYEDYSLTVPNTLQSNRFSIWLPEMHSRKEGIGGWHHGTGGSLSTDTNDVFDIPVSSFNSGYTFNNSNYWLVGAPENIPWYGGMYHYDLLKMPSVTIPKKMPSGFMAFYEYNGNKSGYDAQGIENAWLPVIRPLLNYLTPAERDDLIRRSMRLHWYTEAWAKVPRKWYKKSIQVSAIVGAAISALITWGQDGGSLSAAFISAGKALLIGLAVDKLVDIAVKVGIISPRLATIVKIVISLVTASKGAGWDFSKILTAPNIMKVVNGAFDYYSKKQAHEVQQLHKQLQENQADYDSKVKYLKDKQALLETGVAKDAHLYLNMPSYKPQINLFETPEMMYARHNNFNVIGISHGLISHLSDGLYTKRQPIQEVRDITQEVEDVLLIT